MKRSPHRRVDRVNAEAERVTQKDQFRYSNRHFGSGLIKAETHKCCLYPLWRFAFPIDRRSRGAEGAERSPDGETDLRVIWAFPFNFSRSGSKEARGMLRTHDTRDCIGTASISRSGAGECVTRCFYFSISISLRNSLLISINVRERASYRVSGNNFFFPRNNNSRSGAAGRRKSCDGKCETCARRYAKRRIKTITEVTNSVILILSHANRLESSPTRIRA